MIPWEVRILLFTIIRFASDLTILPSIGGRSVTGEDARRLDENRTRPKTRRLPFLHEFGLLDGALYRSFTPGLRRNGDQTETSG